MCAAAKAALISQLHAAELIDGKAIAATIRQEIAAEVAALNEKTGKVRRGCAGLCRSA